MISDEERREVARKLRDVTEEELRYVFLGEALNFAVGGRCLDDEGDIGEKLILNRLADLIDRPTCHNASGCDDVFRCSECGAEFEPIAVNGNEYGDVFYTPLKPLYCSACGAEVVDEPASLAVTQQR